MPIYEYVCPSCGPFTALRPMADYAKASPCDSCGGIAPRTILTAPAITSLDAGTRRGLALNERSRHEPRRISTGHISGCGCCTATSKRGAASAEAAKSFVGRRPWMISH